MNTSIHSCGKKANIFANFFCIVVLMFNFEYDDLSELPLGQLADRRDWLLSRVDKITQAMKVRVRDSHNEGMSVQRIAKECGVTRRTVYAWLEQ